MPTDPMLTDATDAPNRPRETAAPIRVAVLDDHAAVRAGLAAIVGAAPDMASVGSAHDEAELRWLLRRTDPSVLILDMHHPGLHGLALSVRLKRRSARPRIVLHSGRRGPLLTVAAAVAASAHHDGDGGRAGARNCRSSSPSTSPTTSLVGCSSATSTRRISTRAGSSRSSNRQAWRSNARSRTPSTPPPRRGC